MLFRLTDCIRNQQPRNLNRLHITDSKCQIVSAINNLALKDEVCCFGKVFVSGYCVPLAYNQTLLPTNRAYKPRNLLPIPNCRGDTMIKASGYWYTVGVW